MLSHKEYKKIARKIISRDYSKFSSNEEFLGEVIYALALADTKYNPEIGNLNGYRSQYVKWHMSVYKRNYSRANKNIVDADLSKVLVDKKDKQSLELLEQINKSSLPKRLKLVIYLKYWENLSFREIAKRFNVSFQRIEQLHKKALERLHDSLAT